MPVRETKLEEICSKFKVLAGQTNHHKSLNDMTKLDAAALEYKGKIKL